MIKNMINKITRNKELDMKLDKIEDLPFELDSNNRVKVMSISKDIVSFMHRDRNMEKTFRIKRPSNKSWKNLNVNIGGKINLKLTGGAKNRKPQLLIV